VDAPMRRKLPVIGHSVILVARMDDNQKNDISRSMRFFYQYMLAFATYIYIVCCVYDLSDSDYSSQLVCFFHPGKVKHRRIQVDLMTVMLLWEREHIMFS
jgi:hypothetical protein